MIMTKTMKLLSWLEYFIVCFFLSYILCFHFLKKLSCISRYFNLNTIILQKEKRILMKMCGKCVEIKLKNIIFISLKANFPIDRKNQHEYDWKKLSMLTTIIENMGTMEYWEGELGNFSWSDNSHRKIGTLHEFNIEMEMELAKSLFIFQLEQGVLLVVVTHQFHLAKKEKQRKFLCYLQHTWNMNFHNEKFFI